MEKLIARLERRFGRFAVPNLTWVIVAGMGAVYVLAMLRPGFERLLDLDFEQVKHGQVWRLFTYVFMPGGGSTIWFLLRLYFLWWVGTTLEAHWGSFRYNLYWLIGVVATTVAAILVGGFATNSFLATTLFLAFATLFPDESIFSSSFRSRRSGSVGSRRPSSRISS